MAANKIIERIKSQLTHADFIEQMATELSGADFNTLMLEIFQRRAATVTPNQLLTDFMENRFVKPCDLDALKSRELELYWLKKAQNHTFAPIILSPVSPLGTCSAVGTVSQHKIISSSRRVEVVADATNVLALKIAQEVTQSGKNSDMKNKIIRYATVHRHIRAQQFDNPKFTAHFATFCMVSGGFDKGNFAFELAELNKHIATILELLRGVFPNADMRIKFFLKGENDTLRQTLAQPQHTWHTLLQEIVVDTENKYYQTLQFKIYLRVQGTDIDLADGGLVDWTQQFLGNKKHRTMISGVGIELVQRLMA